MPSIIGEAQTAFVHGRQILDGALVANEVVHWLKKKRKAGVILKMDFQKAYDTVDWDSLIMVMKEMGFGYKWRRWIQHCISSASISVLVNGSPMRPFKMQRGLRQGDPLSPFLFVIMAEVLNKMMQSATTMGLLKGLTVGKDNIQLSQLQFADDTLVFCEAKKKYVRAIKELFLNFQAISGLCVNYQKSGLLVLGKEESWTQRVAKMLECTTIQLPFTYLGIPLGANMRKASSWQIIIDKVQRKLSSWRCSSMSRGGRLTLIKSVLNCLPLYYMSLFKVPRKVADDIIRLQRKFLWSGDKKGRFMPLVKWEVVMKQKSKGGLGVGDIAVKNAALLFKWWWRFATENDQLWKRVVKSIYQESSEFIPSSSGHKCTGPWQQIKKLLTDNQPLSLNFRHHLKVAVGNGARTRFWEDPWLQEGVIRELFPQLFDLSSQQNTAIDRMGWFEGQLWNWVLAWKRELTKEEMEQVEHLHNLLMQQHPVPNEIDSLTWNGEKNYTAKAYQQEVNRGAVCDNLVCKAWMNLAPPKVEFFMWLALLGRLNTKEMLWKKGLLQQHQLSCSLCLQQSVIEDIDHILVSCPISWSIWYVVAKELGQTLTEPETFRQHFEVWMSRQWRNKIMKKIWCSTFFAIAWTLWTARNELLFQQKTFDAVGLCNLIRWRVTFWTRAWKEQLPYKCNDMARNFSSIPFLFQ